MPLGLGRYACLPQIQSDIIKWVVLFIDFLGCYNMEAK